MPAARRDIARMALALGLLLLIAAFLALGVWQVERRAWKHDLIAAVDRRTSAAPVDAPGPAQWARITAQTDAYRRIHVTGRYLPGKRIWVRAVSNLGAGYWVVEPFDTGHFTLFVNRGFIAQDRRTAPLSTPTAVVTVTGLLRMTEPGGAFLRANNPATNRWYSRDVAAMARAHRLPGVAPYFLDADGTGDRAGKPVGGLTVVHFADNHLGYALTWFAMAGMSLWAFWRFILSRA